MNNLSKIIDVLEHLGSEATITELVNEISRKYHIVNDSHLLYAVKSTMEANKYLFNISDSISLKEPKQHKSNLSKVVTFEKFEDAYIKFIEQADKNAITKKSEGSKIPFGFDFESKKNFIDGGAFSQHFGQGAAAKTPYISWHVVSIYYVVENSKIVIGIEQERYSHIKDMQPIKTEAIGNKDRYVAVFYECYKDSINYKELYEQFISVAEKVMELGLQ